MPEAKAKPAAAVAGEQPAVAARAVARYIRIAPRKVRVVINLIRGKSAGEALAILKFTPKAASPVIEKVLRSAIANATHNFDLDADRLVVTEAYADAGPTLKRYHPRQRGQAFPILKRTSHITIVVKEGTPKKRVPFTADDVPAGPARAMSAPEVKKTAGKGGKAAGKTAAKKAARTTGTARRKAGEAKAEAPSKKTAPGTTRGKAATATRAKARARGQQKEG